MFKKNVENFCVPHLISLQQHIPNFTLKLFPMQELQDLKANLVLTIKKCFKRSNDLAKQDLIRAYFSPDD